MTILIWCSNLMINIWLGHSVGRLLNRSTSLLMNRNMLRLRIRLGLLHSSLLLRIFHVILIWIHLSVLIIVYGDLLRLLWIRCNCTCRLQSLSLHSIRHIVGNCRWQYRSELGLHTSYGIGWQSKTGYLGLL